MYVLRLGNAVLLVLPGTVREPLELGVVEVLALEATFDETEEGPADDELVDVLCPKAAMTGNKSSKRGRGRIIVGNWHDNEGYVDFDRERSEISADRGLSLVRERV